MQDGGNDPFQDGGGMPAPMGGEEAAAIGGIGCLIYIAVLVLVVAGGWKMLSKGGLLGVAIIVPVWNQIALAQLAKLQWWMGLLMLIPLVNLVIYILICNGIAKSFGRGNGTAIGLFFLPMIFMPILGFGSAQYEGKATGFE